MAMIHAQPSGSVSVDEKFSPSIEVVLKGQFDELLEKAEELEQYEPIEGHDGWLVRMWRLDRAPGGAGILHIFGIREDEQGWDKDAVVPKPYNTTWSVKTVRNDVSVMAYCGTTPGGPLRVLVEKWLAEKNREVAEKGTFMEDGAEFDMEEKALPTAKLIAKMMKGVESVIRFYPVVTRKRFFHQPPDDVLEDVGFVVDPPTPDGTQKHPGRLSSKLRLFEWLKCQDDCDQTADGDWVRTESWMGILKEEGERAHPWDPDLYGKNRWGMPYILGQGGNGGNA